MAALLSLRVKWRSFGSDKQYNIYYRRDDESIYTKGNAIPLNDNINGNSFDLPFAAAPSTYYWVYVVEVINNKDAPEAYVGVNTNYSIPRTIKVKIKTTN